MRCKPVSAVPVKCLLISILVSNLILLDLPKARGRVYLLARFWPKSILLRHSLTEVMVRPLGRSEEHTSELQSRGHLVCRRLLATTHLVQRAVPVSTENNPLAPA